jgi:hypothetical protein
MTWSYLSLLGVPLLALSVAAGAGFVFVLLRLLRPFPSCVRAVVFGVIVAAFASPGIFPLAGAGHGYMAVIVPAWVTLVILGIEWQVAAPYTAAYPTIAVFLLATSLSWIWLRRRIMAV